MPDPGKIASAYAAAHHTQFIENLNDFLRIPSISTDPEHNPDMVKAAEWVAAQLKKLGFTEIQVFPTARHPVVFAQKIVDPGLPTVLIYGHYDVQPVEPLELWNTEPFVPEQRGENLFARGASDMKGQIVATLSAVESVMSQGNLPVNLKYIVEGEEEIGSPNLSAFLNTHKEMLACTFALNPDAGMIGADDPTIVYALRGLAYFELRLYGPAHDLHSGLYGGAVHNPAIVLSELIAGMHDAQGRVCLPGFYDRVRALAEDERQEMARLPMNDAAYQKITGVPQLYGEAGYSAAERVGARPTLDVNGLYSGFTGAGQKTVIPAWAMAKISMRLVPDQDPADVKASLVRYLEEKTPKTVRWELETFAGNPAVITDRNYPAVHALYKALQDVWHKKPVFKREGGSIPVVLDMQKILGVESVLTGFGLPDDNLHAPNEKLHLPTWYRGIEALVNFLYNLEERL